jgi:hypothetical protein
MGFEIVPDFSMRLNLGEHSFLVDAVYDRVDIFIPLGCGILKLITEEGFLQVVTSLEDAEDVAEQAGIQPNYRDSIRQREYDHYLDFKETTLDDDWLEDHDSET